MLEAFIHLSDMFLLTVLFLLSSSLLPCTTIFFFLQRCGKPTLIPPPPSRGRGQRKGKEENEGEGEGGRSVEKEGAREAFDLTVIFNVELVTLQITQKYTQHVRIPITRRRDKEFNPVVDPLQRRQRLLTARPILAKCFEIIMATLLVSTVHLMPNLSVLPYYGGRTDTWMLPRRYLVNIGRVVFLFFLSVRV